MLKGSNLMFKILETFKSSKLVSPTCLSFSKYIKQNPNLCIGTSDPKSNRLKNCFRSMFPKLSIFLLNTSASRRDDNSTIILQRHTLVLNNTLQQVLAADTLRILHFAVRIFWDILYCTLYWTLLLLFLLFFSY